MPRRSSFSRPRRPLPLRQPGGMLAAATLVPATQVPGTPVPATLVPGTPVPGTPAPGILVTAPIRAPTPTRAGAGAGPPAVPAARAVPAAPGLAMAVPRLTTIFSASTVPKPPIPRRAPADQRRARPAVRPTTPTRRRAAGAGAGATAGPAA